MKNRLLIIAFAVFVIATPAMAELFSIGVISPKTVYDAVPVDSVASGTFTADAYTGLSPKVQIASISGSSSPAIGDSATLIWGIAPGSFSLTMAISDIMGDGTSTPYSAVGTGSLVLTDDDDDSITADLTGKWVRLGTQNFFDGVLSNVYFNVVDGDGTEDPYFNDDMGNAVSMDFSAIQPWAGGITELVTNSIWFSEGAFDVTGGGISITVVPVPIPVAVILGMLGLGSVGAVGLKLRKFA